MPAHPQFVLETLVHHYRPVGAGAYYLQNSLSGRIPISGALQLDPFDVPKHLPPGSYRVYYTAGTHGDPAMETIPTSGNSPPVIKLKEGLGETQTGSLFIREPTSGTATVPGRSILREDPIAHRQKMELEAARFAQEMQENKLLVGKRIRHAAENAEYIVMYRALRHELQAARDMGYESQRRDMELLFDTMARKAALERQIHKEKLEQMQEVQAYDTASAKAPSINWSELFSLGATVLSSLAGKQSREFDEPTEKIASMLSELTRKRNDLVARINKAEADQDGESSEDKTRLSKRKIVRQTKKSTNKKRTKTSKPLETTKKRTSKTGKNR